MKRNYNKVIEKANVITGVGVLLTTIPLGMCLVSFVISSGKPPLEALVSLRWAFYVTVGLLPLGLAFFIGGLGWMCVLKKAKSQFDDEDEAAE
jgi:hypothetical protein